MCNEKTIIIKSINNSSKKIYVENGKLIYNTNINDNQERYYVDLITIRDTNTFIDNRPYLIKYPYTSNISIDTFKSKSDVNTPGVREVFLGLKGTISALDNVKHIVSSTMNFQGNNRFSTRIQMFSDQFTQVFVNHFNDFMEQNPCISINKFIFKDIDETNKVDPIDCLFFNFMVGHNKDHQQSTKNWPVKTIDIDTKECINTNNTRKDVFGNLCLSKKKPIDYEEQLNRFKYAKEVFENQAKKCEEEDNFYTDVLNRIIYQEKQYKSKFADEGITKLAEAVIEDDKKTQIIREFLKNVITSQYDEDDYREFFKDLI